MPLSIRSATPADGELILAFIRELAEYERLGGEVTATTDMIAAALFAPAPRVFCDIAEWESEPAGFALWFYSFSSFQGRHGIYLEDLFVRPAFRRNGIGRALLARLAARCADERLGRLEWAVLDWNEPALRFYGAIGAAAKNQWRPHSLSGEALARLGRAS